MVKTPCRAASPRPVPPCGFNPALRPLRPPPPHPPRHPPPETLTAYPRSVVPDGPAAIRSSLGETPVPPEGRGGSSFRGDGQSPSGRSARAGAGRTPDHAISRRGQAPGGPNHVGTARPPPPVRPPKAPRETRHGRRPQEGRRDRGQVLEGAAQGHDRHAGPERQVRRPPDDRPARRRRPRRGPDLVLRRQGLGALPRGPVAPEARRLHLRLQGPRRLGQRHRARSPSTWTAR